MLRLLNFILFVKNVFSCVTGGFWPDWGAIWRLSMAGVRTMPPNKRLQELERKAQRIVRNVIEACGLSVATSGSVGMAYLVMVGHKSSNPNQDAAAIRIMAERRTAHVHVDTLTLLLIEGYINVDVYRQLYLKFTVDDKKFYEYVETNFKKDLPEETDRGQLPRLAQRILSGENREAVMMDFVCSIWPSLRNQRPAMEA